MQETNGALDLSVIIPFKDKSSLTLACFETLLKYGEPVKEIILLSNNSSDAELAKIQAAASGVQNAKVLVYNEPFNFQKINNWAIRHSTGKFVMMLNNDIELSEESRGVLRTMCKKAGQPNVGCVGCILLYGDRKSIQHAGVYLKPGAMADHLYIGKNYKRTLKRIADSSSSPDITKDMQVSAVTAAALIVERSKFDKIGGMNEAFVIGGGDVDICLRAMDAGYENWLIGSDAGYMIHKESVSRSSIGIPYVDFVESYKSYIRYFDTDKGDPFLSWGVIQNEK